MNLKQAVIVGAGPAGLTAAYYLLKETDIHPIILEQERWVGGLSRTVEFEGNRMDIGGHRFFSKEPEIMDLWKKLLPVQGAPSYDDKMLGRPGKLAVGGPDPAKTDEVMLQRHRISRILYLHHFFDYPVSLDCNTIRSLGLHRMMRIGSSYLYSCLHKKREYSLEDFMINRFGRKLYETFFRDYTEKVWGKSPKDIDVNWGRQRIKGVSLSGAVKDFIVRTTGKKKVKKTETSFIEQFLYPKYGPGQLWEKMSQEILQMGGEIHFDSKAVRLEVTADNRISHVTIEKAGRKESLAADYVFSSMPIAELIDTFPEQTVPANVQQSARSLPYRDFMTVGLLVDRMAIRNTTRIPTLGNIVPDCWIYIQEPDVRIGRLQIFNNWSPYLVEDPEHQVWIGLEYFCQEGDTCWQMPDSSFIDFATGELEKIGVIRRESVRKSVCIRVPKAYPAYFGSYDEFPMIRDYLDRFPNLYCIGRNGQHRYNNMDHSMMTAIEAVRVVKQNGLDKSRIWNVNTDEVYHEDEKHGKQ